MGLTEQEKEIVETHSPDFTRHISGPHPEGWAVVFDGVKLVRRTLDEARALMARLKAEPELAPVLAVMES